jgi:hypothetical protein
VISDLFLSRATVELQRRWFGSVKDEQKEEEEEIVGLEGRAGDEVSLRTVVEKW